MSSALPLLFLLACSGGQTTNDSGTSPGDLDEDGYDTTTDCDDDDPDVHPQAEELCDDIDQDCDDAIDEDFNKSWWPDGDGDGFGDASSAPTESCESPDGNWVHNDRDCQDEDALIFPGAEDVCDGKDNNCNDAIDEDADYQEWWPDQDGDGTGNASAAPVTDCGLDATHATNDYDCNDLDDATPRFADPNGSTGADGSFGDPVRKVQPLLDHYTSCIYLEPGLYSENLFVWSDVAITGLAGPDDTIIDAQGSDSVLYVVTNNAEVRLSGLTLTGGGGLEYETFTNNTYYHYSFGSGIYMLGGVLVLEDSVLSENHGVPYLYAANPDNTYTYDYSYGGAIYMSDVEVTMTDVDILENSASYGSAIYANSGKIDATRVRMMGNESDFAAVYSFTTSFTGRNLLIAQNRGAQLTWYSGDDLLDLQYMTLADNDVTEQLAVYSQEFALTGSIVSGGQGYGVTDWNLFGSYAYSLFDTPFGSYGPDILGGVGLVWAEAEFDEVSDNGDWTDDDYTLSASSPAVNAGPPGDLDLDGSAADMGYWGGPHAP